MALPLDNVTACVFGCGEIDASVRGMVLRHRRGRLVVGVNTAHLQHSFKPDVSLWVDPGVYEKDPAGFDRTLCICDRSVHRYPRHIAIPMRGGPLPAWPNPALLIQRPNTAVIAAIWAIAVGCKPVFLVGCDCNDDGRRAHQLRAMTAARDEAEYQYDEIIRLTSPMQACKALWQDRTKYIQIGALGNVDCPARIRAFYS